jgi:hypothetical protein
MKRILVCTLLVLATVAAPGLAAAQDGTTTLGTDHGLAESGTIETYETSGYANASLAAPQLTLAVGTDYDAETGVSGEPDYSPGFVYVHVDYDETIPRTLRFQLPDDYFHPFPSDIEPESGSGPTAQFRPRADGNATTITVDVDDRTDAVYKIPMAASSVYAARDFGREVTENVTGVRVPRVSGGKPWKYLEPSALAGDNNTVGIIVEDRDATIQYDPKGDGGERWLSVPACDATVGDGAPICKYRKQGDDGTVYLLARESYNVSENPPPSVRYKFDAGIVSQAGSLLDGIRVTVQRTLDMLGGLLPGGGG